MHISYLYASKASNRGLEGCDPTIHTYELNDKHDKPWLILNIKSLNHSPSELPIIFGELPVTGSVALDLKEETQVKSISISLVGKMTTQDIIIYNFVHVSHELWSLEHKANNLTSEVPEDFNSKMSGTFSFPFSLELPKTLQLQNDGASECYQLPATFYTFLGRVVITYEIIVTVTTGGTLSAEHTLQTNAVYIPLIKPDPPSPLRQLAYQNKTPICGLHEDPTGWASLDPVNIRGTFGGPREVEVACILSLAKPLSYTRGSTIPLMLTIQCADTEALDAFSKTSAPCVRLRRILSIQYDGPPVTTLDLTEYKHPFQLLQFQDVIEDIQDACWWKRQDDDSSADKRVLEGEIHLKHSADPSALLGRYGVSYDVALFPFATPTFSSHHNGKAQLQTVKVEIATVYADGPRPISYSPLPDAEPQHEIHKTHTHLATLLFKGLRG